MSQLIKLTTELLASVAPGEVVSGTEWERAWFSEVEKRERLEPDESLGAEHELPAVKKRLLGLFR